MVCFVAANFLKQIGAIMVMDLISQLPAFSMFEGMSEKKHIVHDFLMSTVVTL